VLRSLTGGLPSFAPVGLAALLLPLGFVPLIHRCKPHPLSVQEVRSMLECET